MTQRKVSNRLSIRRFATGDYSLVEPLLTDKDTMKYTGFRVPQTEEQIRTLLKKWEGDNQNALGVWAVEDHEINKFIGWVMLKITDYQDPELGFMLLKNHWGKGYATELANGMLDYGFQYLKLERILAAASIRNTASVGVLKNN